MSHVGLEAKRFGLIHAFEQAKHLAYIVRRGLDEGAVSIEVTAQAEQAWIDHCIEKARQIGDFFENCTPGYYNNEGKPGERTAQDGLWFMAGSLAQCRIYSQHLALQIKAIEEGLLPRATNVASAA